MTELLRPWKLITLAIGIALLCIGAYIEALPDWDIGISFIMGILTYLTAPYVCRTIYRRNWRGIPVALFLAWLSIDGCYLIYHSILGNAMVREANAYASTPLYLFMGIVWMWNGSLRQLIDSTSSAIRPKRRSSPESSD